MKSVTKILILVIVSCMLILPMSASAANGENTQGNTTRLSGDIYVNEGTTIEGDAVTIRGNIYINGSVTGNAIAVFGDIIVNGKVLGDAVAVTGKITVGDNGKVLGDTVEATGGMLKGNNYNYSYRPNIIAAPFNKMMNIFFSLISTTGLFLLAALVYAIMPNKIKEMADTIEPNLGKRIGIGFLAMIGSPIAMIILTIALAVTIIGIIAIPFAWIAYLLAGLVAMVPAYIYVGRKVADLVSKQNLTTLAALAVGMFSLWVIQAITSLGGAYTGWLYWTISLVVFTIGTGTLLDYIFSNRKRGPSPIQNAYYTPHGGEYNPYNQNPNSSYVPSEKESKQNNFDENEDK